MPDNNEDTINIPKINVTFSLTNLFKFFSYITPFLLTFFMIIFSILTGTLVNGLLFIAGLVIFIFFIYLLKSSLKSLQHPSASPMCNLMPTPFTLKREGKYYNSPALSPATIAFVMGYLIYPMILNPENLNPGLIVLLVVLLGINSSVEIHANCTDISGILLGIFVGLLFSIIYVTLFMISGNNKLLFFTETSNNGVQCSKPGKTQFRCFKKHGVVDDLTLRPLKTSDDGQSSSTSTPTAFQQKAKDTFIYINSDTYTKGTSLVEENKIPLGTKCPSSKDDSRSGTICDLGGYCNNNNCVACRTVNDCYKRNYSGGFNSPYNSWNINALKCGVFERNSKSWQVKIYKCGTGDVSILTRIKRAWRGRNNGRHLEEEGGYGIDYPTDHKARQCIEDPIAINTYANNRGGVGVEEPSIDGILFVQKNIANDQNGLILGDNEIKEIMKYFVIDHWVGPSTGQRTEWETEAKRAIKKLYDGLKNIDLYRNLNISNEEIVSYTRTTTIGPSLVGFKENSSFKKDKIEVLKWSKFN